MRLRILRAADEIGGNCIQLESKGQSILLDMGLPLAAPAADPGLLPNVAGLQDGSNPDLLGIVLSHPHQDHYGLLACVHPSVPVYLGGEAHRLLEAASFFTTSANIQQPVTTYHDRRPFIIGPFKITPYLVDHSAFDAHALMIEADGKRVMYSGDFRFHGRKSRQMERLLQHPPENIDVMLMEGTTLGREQAAAPKSESALEMDITAEINNAHGLVLAYLSPQNIDRLVTFYRAAIRTSRHLVIDVYTAAILDALGRRRLPSPTADNVRVFLPRSQKRQIVRHKTFERVAPYRSKRIYPEEIAADPGRWLILFRDSMRADVEAMNCCSDGTVIYSLWPGYLARQADNVRDWAQRQDMAFAIHHTSGHAHPDDLMRMVRSMAPTRLIPIHTQFPEQYATLFPNVEIFPNDAWVNI